MSLLSSAPSASVSVDTLRLPHESLSYRNYQYHGALLEDNQWWKKYSDRSDLKRQRSVRAATPESWVLCTSHELILLRFELVHPCFLLPKYFWYTITVRPSQTSRVFVLWNGKVSIAICACVWQFCDVFLVLTSRNQCIVQSAPGIVDFWCVPGLFLSTLTSQNTSICVLQPPNLQIKNYSKLYLNIALE